MKSLRTKIFSYFLIPIIIAEALIFLSFIGLVEVAFHRQVIETAMRNLHRISASARDLLIAQKYAKLTELLFNEKYTGHHLLYLIVFDDQGKVLSETALNDQFSGPLSTIDIGLSERSYMAAFDQNIFIIDSPIYDVGLLKIGFLRIAYDYEAIEKDFHQALNIAVAIGILFAIVVFILALRLSRSIIRPVENLSKITKEYAGGNLNARFEVSTKDEIGALESDFNNLAESLAQTNKSLSAEKKKLQTKVGELEAWQKNTIDRELKMIELKKEIRRLKEEGGGGR